MPSTSSLPRRSLGEGGNSHRIIALTEFPRACYGCTIRRSPSSASPRKRFGGFVADAWMVDPGRAIRGGDRPGICRRFCAADLFHESHRQVRDGAASTLLGDLVGDHPL